jgi:thiol-disulfide isomerase/thioredoxin
MNTSRWAYVLSAALLAVGFSATPSMSQQQAAVKLRAAKYGTLAEAVAQNRGKVVVVDLWAFFCQPCKEGFPHLVRLHQKYAGKGLAVISVCLDPPADRAKAEQFLVKNTATFTNLWLDERPEVWTNRFRTDSIPCLFVFDRRGRWTQFKVAGGKGISQPEIEQLVVKLLAER